MALDKELIDKLLEGYQKPEDLIGENGLLKQLTKALVERAMNAELTHHLGYEKSAAAGRGKGNSRNGKSRKKLKGDFGEVDIEVPRDRNGDFEPKIVEKHQRRFTGFDDKILSMYARGFTAIERTACYRARRQSQRSGFLKPTLSCQKQQSVRTPSSWLWKQPKRS